jgi:hypothetical protein
VVALDAEARAMADASRRAAARTERGGVPNIRFLADGVERLPIEFDGFADLVIIRFPWGSLLRGALGLDAAVTTSIARLVAPDGRLEIVLSIVDRDRAAISGGGDFGPADIEHMATAFGALGLELTGARRLAADEHAVIGSSWARRLGSDPGRPVWQVGICRPG